MYKIYDETQPPYLETDASGIRAALLQTRNGWSYPRDIAPDNSIPRPIKSTSKSLSSAEKRYSSIEKKALGILHRLKKFHHYCFMRGEYNHRSQAVSSNLQTRYSNVISENTTNSPQHIPIQSMRIICKPGPNPRLHDDTAVTTGNLTRQSSTTAQRLYHQILARVKINTTRHANVLDISWWYGSDQCSYTQRQMYSNTD